MTGTSPLPPCPVCGFDGAGLTPRDAAAALRSYPRRFAALVLADAADVPPADADVHDAVAREAAAARQGVSAAGEAMRRVLITDDPSLAAAVPVAPQPAGVEEEIERLAAEVNPLADLALQTSGRSWERTGRRDGQPVRALDLLREAVHAGAHHLRAAQKIPGVTKTS